MTKQYTYTKTEPFNGRPVLVTYYAYYVAIPYNTDCLQSFVVCANTDDIERVKNAYHKSATVTVTDYDTVMEAKQIPGAFRERHYLDELLKLYQECYPELS